MKAMTFLLGILLLTTSVKSALAQSSQRELMENCIDRYLDKNFNTVEVFFVYYGNVEIRSATQTRDGNYYVEGRFDYKNAIGLQVRRSFRATLNILLGEYAVKKFEFYYYTDPDGERWIWEQI